MNRGLCIFGGTFNPPHNTHRRIVTAALEHLRPARMLVVPCGDHPLKPEGGQAPAEHRLAMCQRAFADMGDSVEINDIELRRDGPSYTVDTVRAARGAIGLDDPLWLLIGSDNVPELDQWHDYHSLLELATVIVYPRAGYPVNEKVLQGVDLRFKHKQSILDNVLDIEPDDVNATAVRTAIQRGQTPFEVDAGVLAYIQEHQLYRS